MTQVRTTETFRRPIGFCAVHSDERVFARYYDPSTAQFLSIDPKVMETGQPYSYAHDDPVNSNDPTGLCDAVHSVTCDAVLLAAWIVGTDEAWMEWGYSLSVAQGIAYLRASSYIVNNPISVSLENEDTVFTAEMYSTPLPSPNTFEYTYNMNSLADQAFDSEINYGPVPNDGGPVLNCVGQGISNDWPFELGAGAISALGGAFRKVAEVGEPVFLVYDITKSCA